MSIATLLQYLFGRRRAIEAAASCRSTVWLGLVFVLSAGFAREYDGEDLLHEPWHLLLPLAASLLTSFLLFAVLEGALPREHSQPSDTLLSRYRVFLGLYWLTAPLAWLYAIPVERYTDAADAVRTNLWLLGIVSLWRVALMTRVVSLLYARSATTALFLVMFFADSVAMVIFWTTPLPILSVMGGIRLSESERVIQATGYLVRFIGTVTWPVWLIGAITVAVRSWRRSSAGGVQRERLGGEPRSATLSLWTLAVLSLLVWTAVLPRTQPEQINRRRVESALRAGQIQEAIEYMSRREREDFPPHWDPPPRVGYGERQPPLVPLVLHTQRAEVTDWVQELFREKLVLQSRADPWSYNEHAFRLEQMDDEQLVRYVRLLESLPEGPQMARYHQEEIRIKFDAAEEDASSDALSKTRRAALEEILAMVPEDRR